jgi:hypothetical protein
MPNGLSNRLVFELISCYFYTRNKCHVIFAILITLQQVKIYRTITVRHIWIFTALLILTGIIVPVKGQNPIISHDSIVFIENTLKKVSKNVNFTIVPGPVYGTTQKLGLVVVPMLVYTLNRKDTLSPPSSSALMVYFDFYGSWVTSIKQSLYWNRNKWRAFISAGIGNLQLKYFGIGRDTSIVSNNDSNYVWTHQEGLDVSAICFRKIYRGLYGGLEYRYINANLQGSDSASTAQLTAAGLPVGKHDESILIPVFVWDNRDNIFWSVKGYYANLNVQLANKVLMSSSDFLILSGWVNGYHRLIRDRNNLILAWHFYYQVEWGDLPYLRYSIYGQGDNVTGYTRGKYVNYSETTIQAELRYEFWKFISCGGYAGTGKVFPTFTVFGQSRWLHFGGLRVYLNIIPSRNIRLRLDAAFGRKDFGFYVGIGQGF